LADANNHLSRKSKMSSTHQLVLGMFLVANLATRVSVAFSFQPTEGAVVIDYSAIGVLVFIALLGVARLFPPPGAFWSALIAMFGLP
jgi:hypothetical protein